MNESNRLLIELLLIQPQVSKGVSPCQLKVGREVRTLLPSLESNLSEVVPNHDAVTRKDAKKLKQLTVGILTRGMEPEPALSYSQGIQFV